MKILSTLILLLSSVNTFAAEGVLCDGLDCAPVQIEQPTRGSGLLNLRDDQKTKLDGVKQLPQNNNYMFSGKADQTETSADIKLSEIEVGTCLINPESGKTFYKVLEKDVKSGKVRYVAENEEHQYMLKGDVVFWQMQESNAFKKLKRFPCQRTPNLWDDRYVAKCTHPNTVGTLYCNPKSKLEN